MCVVTHASGGWRCFHCCCGCSSPDYSFLELLLASEERAGPGTRGGRRPLPQSDTGTMAENGESWGASEAELDPVEYTLRKRLPHRLPRRPNDIYVNMKTDFKAQLARCQKLLEGGGGGRGQGGCPEIYIHGLGLAINRAINIALQLQASSFGALQVAANTSTVELVDELEPETNTREPLTRTRNNSAIHIRVFRVTPK
ncbi:LOW QUALITY PROTEIN: ribonuclease P protein subunit p20 [Petaurus breviceps papuanus]|uniref:LOW QUALITY PROTEIN: ribonuclease P protein subunit p20 n=1 Tax=Petaurus breviceps papuanus TaxID=3040969 RepID=UPI0036D9F296